MEKKEKKALKKTKGEVQTRQVEWGYLPLRSPEFLSSKYLKKFEKLQEDFSGKLNISVAFSSRENLNYINLIQDQFNYLSFLFSGQKEKLEDNYFGVEGGFTYSAIELKKTYWNFTNNRNEAFLQGDEDQLENLAKIFALNDYLLFIQETRDSVYAASVMVFNENRIFLKLDKNVNEFVEYLYNKLSRSNYITGTYEVFRNRFIVEKYQNDKITWLGSERELISFILNLDKLDVIKCNRKYAEIICSNFRNNKLLNFKSEQIRITNNKIGKYKYPDIISLAKEIKVEFDIFKKM